MKAVAARGLAARSRLFHLALTLGLACPLRGQVAPMAPAAGADPAPADTVVPREAAQRALSEARLAQRRFEVLRRQWAPQRRSAWSGSECDEIVGRICLRHDEGGDWWPAPEDPRIRGARDDLLTDLADAARVLPGNPWVLGQRVLYLAEAGRWSDAEGLARACLREEAERCGVLLGLALHGQGRFPEAEATFRDALSWMDVQQRARWTDPSVVLDRAGESWLEDAREQGDPEAASERVWRLADPLLLAEGNDRLTAHWARRVWASLKDDAANAYTLSWGRDLEEVLVRYGWEVGWERMVDLSASQASAMVGHHHPESRGYMPPGDVLAAPARASPDAWPLTVAQPMDGYAPAYAPVIIPAEGELFRFPRGDRVVVLATFALPEDTTEHANHSHPAFEPAESLRGLPVQAGLFLLTPETGAVLETRRSGESEGALLLDAPAGEYLASVEVWSRERGFAGRLRQGVSSPARAANAPTLSDLVPLDGPLPDSSRLEDALPHMRRSRSVVPGERLGVGWEVHGGRGEVLSYRLSLRRVDPGILRTVGQWLGVASPRTPLQLSWSEAGPPSSGQAFRSLEIELPDVEPGSYLLQLELSNASGMLLVSERKLLVERR